MGKRFTITEKWEDGWFWQLKPYEKLLWNYLCDKCDLAGFWEINLDLACVQTKIPKKALLGAVQGLSRGYLTNGKYLWLRNFIRHQGNYPLNPNNNAHKHILALLERHTDFDVDFFQELEKTNTPILGAKEGLLSPPSKGNSKSISKGKGKYDEPFENFWKKFKGRWNPDKGRYDKGGKWDAWLEWQKLFAVEKQRAIETAPLTGAKFTKDACRWLKGKRWEDFNRLPTTPPLKKAVEKEKAILSERYKAMNAEELKQIYNRPRASFFEKKLIEKIRPEVLKEK